MITVAKRYQGEKIFDHGGKIIGRKCSITAVKRYQGEKMFDHGDKMISR